MELVKCNNLCKEFDQKQILKNINLNISKGKIIGLLGKNVFTNDIKTQQHINPINKNDMADKTLALLHERLEQGSISLDEFNRRCEELGKKRSQ